MSPLWIGVIPAGRPTIHLRGIEIETAKAS